MAFNPDRRAWFVWVAFIEIKQDFVLASKVGGGLPDGCVVSPFHKIMEAILVIAIE